MSRRPKRIPNTCDDCRRRLLWVTLVNRGEGRDERKRLPLDAVRKIDSSARLLEHRFSHAAREHVARWLEPGRTTPTEPGWTIGTLHASTCSARKRRGPAPVRDLDPLPTPVEESAQLELELPNPEENHR